MMFLTFKSPPDSIDGMTGSVSVSLLTTIDVSTSDEEETSLEDAGIELILDDEEVAWARVSGTTTTMVATIKDKEKYPNRRRR